MYLKIPYMDSFQEVEVSDKNILKIVYPSKVEERNERALMISSINTPINSLTLSQFVKNHDKILLAVNDQTRPTPTERMLDPIMNIIEDKIYRVIVATGTHRPPHEDEYRRFFGKYYDILMPKTIYNDAKNDGMIYMGKTSRGTPIRVNEIISEVDGLIALNSVEPHYFAGFTGGRKSIIPGLSAYNSVEKNHSLALSPDARSLKLRGNPVHEDMEEYALKVSREIDIFSINAVLDGEHRIYDVYSGDIIDVLYPAAEVSKKIFVTYVEEKADIVVSVAQPPLDINLYQSQKALDNAKHIVRKGGIIILVSPCREGIGLRNFFDLLSSAENPKDVFEKIKAGYKLGYHKAAKMAEILMENDVYIVSNLDENVVKKTFMKPFRNIRDAINTALENAGGDARILFMMNGGLSIPLPK